METIRQVLAVSFVLGLLAAALWWMRTKGRAHVGWPRRRDAGSRSLRVVERLSLTPHHSLHLVQMADRLMLIGVSPSGCSLLDSSILKTIEAHSSERALQERTTGGLP